MQTLKNSKRLISILFLLAFIMSPTIMILATGNASGNSTGQGISTGGKLQAPGVLIGIREIKNNITDTEFNKLSDSQQAELGKVGYQVYKSYYKNAPEPVKEPGTVTKYALITRGDANYNFKAKNNQFVYGAGTATTATFDYVYEVNRLTDYAPYTSKIDKTLMNSTYRKTFMGGELTYKQLKAIISDKSVTKDDAGSRISKALADTAKVWEIFGYKTPTSGMSATERDEVLYGNNAQYLDLLVSVNTMCGGQFNTEIEKYLKDQNSNDAEYFYIIDLIAVVGVKDSSNTDMKWYTYPSFMASMTSKDISKFMNYTNAKHTGAGYRDNTSKFKEIDKAYESSLYSTTTNTSLKYVWDWAWYNEWSARYSLMPRDLNSKQTWGSGYSFITSVYPPPTNPIAKSAISVTVTPHSKIVKAGDKVSADIALSLKALKEQDLKETLAAYDIYAEKKIFPKLTITLGFNNSVGTGTSSKAYDTLVNTDGWTFNSSTMTLTRTFNKSDDRANLKKYLNGTYNIKLTDSDITITKKTRNWYTAKAQLYWDSTTFADFTGNGTDSKYKKNAIANTGGDTAAWFLEPAPDAEVGIYYSSPRTPYVEIKEGSPNNEKFEAMAGVPTTENLYIGFGATEFVSNMEVAKKEAPATTRTYTIKYIVTNCIEVDAPCTGTCPGPITDPKTGTVTHPKHSNLPCGAASCNHNQQINHFHPHTHTFTGTITQPIDAFPYTSITGLDLWQLNRAILEGNADLFTNPNQTINPNTGFKAFVGQTGYSSGNGRLVFSNGFAETDKYGNTTITYTDSTMMTKAAADTAATNYMNNLISSMKVKATVISDYAVLTTTEGYQSMMYHEYDSDTVNVASARFTTGSASKSITGDKITFSKKPVWKEFWTNNALTAAQWSESYITRSGYNGNYVSYGSKWNNTNITIPTDPSAKWTNFPNLKQSAGSTVFSNNGFSNQRLTRLGLNIRDSTDSSNKWSASDGVDPVLNGYYDTGHCFIEYDKVIAYGTTDGENYATNGTMHREEVGYSPNHTEVNDIVVHNPVSAQNATVVANDKKYDLRSATSLAEGGDPETSTSGSCPRDASCEYSKLTCTIAPHQHTDECYALIEAGFQHVGGLNAHVHSDSCYEVFTTTTSKYGYVKVAYTSASNAVTLTCPTCGRTLLYAYRYDKDTDYITVYNNNGVDNGNGFNWKAFNDSYQRTSSYSRKFDAITAYSTSTGYFTWHEYNVKSLMDSIIAFGVANNGRTVQLTSAFEGVITDCPFEAPKFISATLDGIGDCYISAAQSNYFTDYIGDGTINYGGFSFGWGQDVESCSITFNGVSKPLYLLYDNGFRMNFQINKTVYIYASKSSEKKVTVTTNMVDFNNLLPGTRYVVVFDAYPAYGFAGASTIKLTGAKGTITSFAGPTIDDDKDYTFEFTTPTADTSYRLTINGSNAEIGALKVYHPICNNSPNTHVCTSACGTSYKKILTCTDPHHYAAGEPWDYNNPNNHYDFGDLRCYTPCMDGDVLPEDFTLHDPITSIIDTEYGSAIKFSSSFYRGASATAKNIFTKDDTYVIAFDAWSTVNGDAITLDAFPDTLPETNFSLTTKKSTYVWSCNSTKPEMQMASLRFFPGGSGTKGDVHITNIRVGICANAATGHIHTADCIHSKHKPIGNVVKPDGSVIVTSNIFINLDRTFKVYFPYSGDFAQQPELHGIAECSITRGMGYTDNMDTSKWTREKYITLPVNVIDEKGRTHWAGEEIDLLTLPNTGNVYTFYCVLANSEAVNAGVQFLSVANNAPEIEAYDDSTGETNRDREYSYRSAHSGSKRQVIDVVGYIGSLTLNDTGDFRFATLFKQKKNDGTWLIPNLVPGVNYKLPNKILSDTLEIRQEIAEASIGWHSTYGITSAITGGKSFPYVSLPLTPSKNIITSLQNQPMRPGYKLYMDVETDGNYYGENYDEDMNSVDTDMYYKMQITPRYWALNLDSSEWQPVDVYMGNKGNYTPVVMFNDKDRVTEWIYYLDWLEESARRNYTAKEKEVTNNVAEAFSLDIPSQAIEGKIIPGFKQRVRTPITTADPIGTANRLFLNDLNRTFIGSSRTYGQNKNPDGYFNETYFNRQSQRWHFTLGLPSSSVFVKTGKECSTENIEEISRDDNTVIVCAVDIKVKGEIWTLEYNGNTINNSGGSGVQIVPGGKIYAPPTDPVTGNTLTDPIVVVYSGKYTSKDDLKLEGTH